MDGTPSQIHLPPLDLSECTLMQLVHLAVDVSALIDDVPSRGSCEAALMAFDTALRAEILARPKQAFAEVMDYTLESWRYTGQPGASKVAEVIATRAHAAVSTLKHILSDNPK